MSAYTVDRNAEGAWRVCALVDDGTGEWFHTETYYGYTRREVLPLFRRSVSSMGARVVR